MVSERTDDGKRSFSDKIVVEYFRVLRKVIASAWDEKIQSRSSPRVESSRNLFATRQPEEAMSACLHT
jgi:hypothetical protein